MKFHPKKRFGQHFLRDTGILAKIVERIRPTSEDIVIELGAGHGELSLRIVPSVYQFIAIEVDPRLFAHLDTALTDFSHARAILADILKLDLAVLLPPHTKRRERIRVIGNLPYNIATAIIARLLEVQAPISDMFFLIQLEVAQRITAAPRSRHYGYFSVRCQQSWNAKIELTVSPACFVPRPKVMSALISLKPRAVKDLSFPQRHFIEITKAAFSYRRKTLANSLRRDPVLGLIAGELLSRAGIDGGLRPGDISVAQYEQLAWGYHSIESSDQ